MNCMKISTDFNGIVFFDPERLKLFFDGNIKLGENIYEKMTSTSAGDEVVKQGIVIPILGINDSVYEIFIRSSSAPSQIKSEIIFSNGIFPLRVDSRLVAADLTCFLEWEEEMGWYSTNVKPGCYAVTINGFRTVKNRQVTDFGFEIILSPQEELPIFTGNLAANMQVQELPSR